MPVNDTQHHHHALPHYPSRLQATAASRSLPSLNLDMPTDAPQYSFTAVAAAAPFRMLRSGREVQSAPPVMTSVQKRSKSLVKRAVSTADNTSLVKRAVSTADNTSTAAKTVSTAQGSRLRTGYIWSIALNCLLCIIILVMGMLASTTQPCPARHVPARLDFKTSIVQGTLCRGLRRYTTNASQAMIHHQRISLR